MLEKWGNVKLVAFFVLTAVGAICGWNVFSKIDFQEIPKIRFIIMCAGSLAGGIAGIMFYGVFVAGIGDVLMKGINSLDKNSRAKRKEDKGRSNP